MKIRSLVTSSLLALAQTAALAQTDAPDSSNPAANSPRLAANYGKLPLSFEANEGQTDPQVKFLSRGQGFSLFLTNSAAVLALSKADPSVKEKPKRHAVTGMHQQQEKRSWKTDVVRMELAGAKPGVQVAGGDQLPGKTNYFIGNDQAKWHSDVPTYAKVRYSGVYPGVDLVYYGNQRQLEYDFVVAPGADPKPVRLHFAGAEKLRLNADGDLSVVAKDGEIAFHKPLVYQMKDGQRQPVEGRFSLLARNTVSFKLGSYDRSRKLTIDPVLAYSTFLGGTGNGESSFGCAVDKDGAAYIAGSTYSHDFPVTAGAFQHINKVPSHIHVDTAFVTKMNAAGTALIYSTYLGGSGENSASGIAIDSSGHAYVTGISNSLDFPVTSDAFQKSFTGNAKVFVTKLAPDGSALDYSTYLGGSGYDQGTAIAIDAAGHAYITGYTSSTDFPVSSNAFQKTTNSPNNTAFITKFDLNGSSLDYSTYLGGSEDGGAGIAVAVDALGNAYVTGFTNSSDFPVTAGAFQSHKAGTQKTGFVSKLNPAGSGLVYSTYLGGSGGDLGDAPSGIKVDNSGSAYVAGYTFSPDFPVTPDALQTVNNLSGSNYIGFVTKLDPGGTALTYSTFLGGLFPSTRDYDGINAIAIDQQGHAFVTGHVRDPDFPITPDAFQKTNKAVSTVFVTELNSAGSAVLYSTYLGGTYSENGWAIAVDQPGNVYVTGTSHSLDFPVSPGAVQKENKSIEANGILGNLFLTKFAFSGITSTSLSSSKNPATTGQSVTFTAAIAPAEGTATPTGAVSFLIDGGFIPHADLDGTGHATYVTKSLPAGLHAVVATYLGDSTYSTSYATLTQTMVGQVAAPTFWPLGSISAIARRVTISTATRGATIYYTTDGTRPTTGSQQYTAPITVSSTETINAIAVETGDTASAVGSATYTINPSATFTTTSVKSSVNPSTVGQPVTFTATVTPASGPTPTGSVTFLHTSVVMGTSPLVNGVATFTTSSLAANTSKGYGIISVYTGSATDAESVSPTLAQVVNP